MSRADPASDADVQRKYYERVQRSREMPVPEGGHYFDRYEAAYQHSQRMKAAHREVWAPYRSAWLGIGDRQK